MIQDPIIITGAARSGTSMTAGLIHICGAFGGDMFGPNQFNEKGMFENVGIREDIIKPYLRKIGVDPKGQRPLPNNRQVFEATDPDASNIRKKVQGVFTEQGYEVGPWFIKEPKIILTWYLWHKAFPNAKWVIVRRNGRDIARSCHLTRFMNAYKTADEWLPWVETHDKRICEIKTAQISYFEFWPSKIISGDFQMAKEMVEYLGLAWNENICRAFIDPQLYEKL